MSSIWAKGCMLNNCFAFVLSDLSLVEKDMYIIIHVYYYMGERHVYPTNTQTCVLV